MVNNHSWPGIPHYSANLFSHFRPVTVDRAFGACRFIAPETALLNPLHRIIQQGFAFTAEGSLGVMSAAINIDHEFDGLSLTTHAIFFDEHLPLLI
jgi:hypothetical protein